MLEDPKVSIIILNWNGLEDTIECLESLKKITYPNYEIIVVDNGSKGNDAGVLEEKFGDYIHLIRNDKNYGYTGGNNIAIRYVLNNSSPDYLLILNNDTVVAPDFLTEMVRVAERDRSIGIIGPKIYYYGSPELIQSVGVMISMWTGQAFHAGNRSKDVGQYDIQRDVDYVSGCCLLAKREVFENVGLFDESYFCYCEDTDYCIRAERVGYKTVYLPQAKIWHKKPMRKKLWGKTRQQGNADELFLYHWARNKFRFMRKHATTRQYRSFLLYFFGYQFWFTTGVCLLYHRDVGRFISFYRGVKDGLFDSDAGARHYTSD